jgi:hypothetical protein
MKLTSIKPEYLLGGVALLAVAYVWWKGPAQVVSDVAGGAVQELGSLFGVPKTDPTRCAQAKAAGSLWEQSLYCPASEFLGGVLRAPLDAIYSQPRPPLTTGSGGVMFDELGNVIGTY